ncbi:bifunctional oligoribonuclease/PAP phosphatase NrnA [soil metagenome]
MNQGETVPPHRQEAIGRVVAAVGNAQRVVLTTHVNADGDGTGSQAALAAWLTLRGTQVSIVNPTAFPDTFRFLLQDDSIIADAGTVAADRALAACDLIVVIDTAEHGRIGRVAKALKDRAVVVIDHHVDGGKSIQGESVIDPSASAAGELIHDFMVTAELPRPWPQQVLEGIYTAIVTDTGSFRFSNTTRRAHAIAGDLIEQGVDPEQMYRRIFATVPLRRVELLRHALETLEVDREYAITSISLERGVMEGLGASSDDLDGIIDHARSIEGTEVALLFRETSDGSTKVSFRSAGAIDVNAVARQFGGGGHIKASGALMAGTLAVVRPRVLEATRRAVREGLADFRAAEEQA